MRSVFLLLAGMSVLVFQSCLKDKIEVIDEIGELCAEDTCTSSVFCEDIRPLFQTYCSANSSCHAEGGSANADFINFSDIAGRSVKIKERINLPLNDGKHMPQASYPQFSSQELQKVNAWLDSGAPGCD